MKQQIAQIIIRMFNIPGDEIIMKKGIIVNIPIVKSRMIIIVLLTVII